MVFQVQEEPDWKIRKSKALYCVIVDVHKRLSPELVLSSGTVSHSKVDVYFALYSRFSESNC